VPEDEKNNKETTEEGGTPHTDNSIRDAQAQTPVTQIPPLQVQEFPDICSLEGLQRDYYADVGWFKAVILAIFLVIFLTGYTLSSVARKGDVLNTILGLLFWIILIPAFTLGFYMLVWLSIEKADMKGEWRVHCGLMVGCCIFASGCVWYDRDIGLSAVSGVGFANGITILSVAVLYMAICFWESRLSRPANVQS
jgi:hypothetical protein